MKMDLPNELIWLILTEQSYLEWIDQMMKINKEYHRRFYYHEDDYFRGLHCSQCFLMTANWRNLTEIKDMNSELRIIWSICQHEYCLSSSYMSKMKLPKNY